jgi:hypothetical protein
VNISKAERTPSAHDSAATPTAIPPVRIGVSAQCALFAALGSVRMLTEHEASLLVARLRTCLAESGIPGLALRYEIRDLKAGTLVMQGDEIIDSASNESTLLPA